MTPREYCEQKMSGLLRPSPASHDKATLQVLSILSFLAQRDRTDHEFVADLKLMAESAEHSGRPALADGAHAVLADWDTSSRSPTGPAIRGR